MNTLEKIVIHKKKELSVLKRKRSIQDLRKLCEKKYKKRSFRVALEKAVPIGIIAEIKRASPSEGRLTFRSHKKLADIYNESEADVISVLTDKKFFKGDLSYLQDVREKTRQPIFRKDFIIDPYQVYETYAAKADAFLIIASILTQKEIEELVSVAESLGLEYIIEVHTKDDIKKVLNAVDNPIIGINNRDLTKMDVCIGITEKLLKHIPSHVFVVSESGIATAQDIRRVRSFGVRAVLVGSSIVKAKDPKKKIVELKNTVL